MTVQTTDPRCDECGYPLRGLSVTRCPECGTVFDPDAAPQADIPWLRRQELGLSPAYMRTVAMILTRPRQFAAELCRPVRVSAEDAYEFRLLTIFLASTATLIALMGYWQHSLRLYPFRTAPLLAMLWIVIASGLRLATDLPTFIWSGLPRRASDLSPLHQYACAPLALVPLVMLPLLLGLVLFEAEMVNSGGQLMPVMWLFIAALLLPVALLSWWIPLRFMQTATGDRKHVAMLAIYLPIHWLTVCCMIGLIGFTAVYFLSGV